ncbi:M15 family metallopeptidase [Vibrio sp. FNV 38]|nr:M15 family metallopeptidase [Vibrio sp. FNV 38]
MKPSELIGLASTHLMKCQIGQKTFSLHPMVKRDLLRLKHAADNAGFNFCIASGFRDFTRQQLIWDGKMKGSREVLSFDGQLINIDALSEKEQVDAVLIWSALPGTSRHHWGSDFDVYNALATSKSQPLQLSQEEYLTGPQTEFFLWLKRHAETFGFFFPYDGVHSGYQFEPWHISHRATWQNIKTQLAKEPLLTAIVNHNIVGVSTIVQQFDHIYTHYVLSVNEGKLS